MAYKMKGAPMMANTKSHGTNKNFKMSGMKNADGGDVKPGAPGFFGKLLDPLGLAKKAKGMFGKKGGGAPCPPAGAAAAPAAAPAAAAADPDLAAGPVAPAAAAPVPEEVPAPTQMRKESPAKDMKTWTAQEMRGKNPPFVGKELHNDKHKRKEIDSDHKAIKRDKKANKPKSLK